MQNELYEWEINPQESKHRSFKAVSLIAPAILIFGIILAFEEKSWFVLWVVVVILTIYCLYIFLLKRHQPRKYIITEVGITIFKGLKFKVYNWSEFENFHIHSLIINKDSSSTKGTMLQKAGADVLFAVDDLNKINGKIFYLKKVKKGFFGRLIKTFVAVYSEPENQEQVESLLSKHIVKVPITHLTETGVVILEYN